MKMHVTGFKRLQKTLARAHGAAAPTVAEVSNDLAMETQATIIDRMIESPPTGETYERYKPRRIHTASSPGQYPRVDTQKLIRSFRIKKATASTPHASLWSVSRYAADLEFGTSRMAARPFFFRTLWAVKRSYGRKLRDTFNRKRGK